MILRFVSVSFLSSPAYAEAVPYVWSLVLSFFMVILSIASLYAARFNSQFEMSDLSSLRTMFDRFPAWGKRASWAQKNSFESFNGSVIGHPCCFEWSRSSAYCHLCCCCSSNSSSYLRHCVHIESCFLEVAYLGSWFDL